MDGASTVIVVLIFIAAIFSSMGGNQGYTPPSAQPAKPPINKVYSSVDPSFAAVAAKQPRTSIHKYISRYRKTDEAAVIADSIMRHSKEFDVNPKLVAALIARESRYNPKAVSSAGAKGLGQLMPATCKSTGVTEPFNIDQNVRGTVRYMKYLLGRFKNYSDQVAFSIAGYLEGPNAVARKQGYRTHTKAYVNDIIKIYHKI